MVQDERVSVLNDAPVVEGRYVLYWMQQSQRAKGNHALEYAVGLGNELRRPVLVGFGLMDDYPEANLRHYRFMLEGLAGVAGELRKRGIGFVIRRGRPTEVALRLGREAAAIVCDCGYLEHQRRWRDEVVDGARRRVVQVESDVVVPVETATDKAEYAARTIRPKLARQLKRFLVPLREMKVEHRLREVARSDVDLDDLDGTLAATRLDCSTGPVSRFAGGYEQARLLLRAFVRDKLRGYGGDRAEPAAGIVSHMSPYLHFGQISPVEVALAVMDAPVPQADKDAYLEQLIVRRELSCNYVWYNPRYASYDGLPGWARRTLEKHRSDPRQRVYTRAQLESADTDDPWWNAAMREMLTTGYMHNYMRMYWGKRVIGWKADPREAFEDLLYLNNKHFVDGRDPNSYAGVGWCFGLHDRPWKARPVFGQVRYMNAKGLERKFDMPAYARMVNSR